MIQEKYRVLVADDETRIHDFFIEALTPEPVSTMPSELKQIEHRLFMPEKSLPGEQDQGYELSLCTSGTEAVDRVARSIEKKRPYAVMFIDVRMPPGPDGVWAAEKIRQMDKDVEIVIVTAFSDITPADILKRVPPAHKLLYLQKPCYVLEIRHMAASLTAKWSMERELRRIHDQQRRHIQTQKSALEDAQKTLERMQKLDALGMLAGTVAHDFNNIMTAIMGHTELAILDSDGNENLCKRMEQIQKAGYKAKDLVNRILTFSRQNEPEFVELSLSDTISDVLKLIQAATPPNIHLTSKGVEPAGLICADSTQVHQIVMNLYSNAVHAMKDKGGVLSICLGRPDDFSELSAILPACDRTAYAVLCVSDTGCGMDQATMQNIFNPYFTTKGKDEGTGLGLAVVHNLVKKQGGFIHVLSEVGEGTRFYVLFKALTLTC